ncbi:MAG: helix-turn-helix transcriptional regulator [Alphaproteobacteria bacterium]
MQLSYHEIWKGIENLAAKKGLSLSALAVKSGLDPTSFNKSKRVGPDGRKRWPSTESMNKLLQATNTTLFEFMALAGEAEQSRPVQTIPLLGLVKAGRDGYFDSDGYPLSVDTWDGIEFPLMLNKNVYALEVSGDSMEPAYRDGDKLIVSPESEVRRGDRVVVKLVTGEVMVKELARESARQVELKSLNPLHKNIIVPTEDVLWMKRVLWVSQ